MRPMTSTIAFVFLTLMSAAPASAGANTTCPGTGDVVLSAKTSEVDLYQDKSGTKTFVKTLKQAEFPSCLAITGKPANAMLPITYEQNSYWVPQYMVNVRTSSKDIVCGPKNLASNDIQSDDQKKMGGVRGAGEGCGDAKGSVK